MCIFPVSLHSRLTTHDYHNGDNYLSRRWVSGAAGPKCRDSRQARSDAERFNENAKVTGTLTRNAGTLTRNTE